MKKLIAKLLNAARNRRRERKQTTEIEVGEIYHIKHTMRKSLYLRVKSFNDVWVEGLVIDAETLQPCEETILMKHLCTFTKLKEGKT